MARVYALDEDHCDVALRNSLQNQLRVFDECVVLPQAFKSSESGAFKNVVMNLNGQEPSLNPDVFSPNWFAGVSGLRVPSEQAEALMKDPVKRAKALKALAKAIPSEMGDDGEVGPLLDCTADDRDTEKWVCGFDSPSCCVGLYSTQHSKSPDPNRYGISRSHNVYFLICKAGGGLAAQTFHSRLSASLKKGMSLDECFAEGNVPGAQALRRVSMAAQRNRQRILCLAAEALGLTIDTLNDTACAEHTAYRVAVCDLNVVTNSLQKVNVHSNFPSYHYFSGCIDSHASQCVLTSSNVGEGFLIFADHHGNFKVNVRNSALGAIPFVSTRIYSNKDIVLRVAEELKQLHMDDKPLQSTHPDTAWITERFAWKSRDFGLDMEPPPLMGTHSSEHFASVWCRELGLSACRPIRVSPEIVCLSATEPAKLRAAARHVLGSEKKR